MLGAPLECDLGRIEKSGDVCACGGRGSGDEILWSFSIEFSTRSNNGHQSPSIKKRLKRTPDRDRDTQTDTAKRNQTMQPKSELW